jgi:hypothetical protein
MPWQEWMAYAIQATFSRLAPLLELFLSQKQAFHVFWLNQKSNSEPISKTVDVPMTAL